MKTNLLAPGQVSLRVELVLDQSTVTGAQAASPMKLLTPRWRGLSVAACLSSFGGGLVAGDQTRLDLHLGPGARCVLGTQASTKIYQNPAHLPCGHTTRAVLDPGALLVFAPAPIQPFAGSSFVQRQEFRLAPGAGLALVDWVTSGRAACGERWAFQRFDSRNEVLLSEATEQRLFLDWLCLDPVDGRLAAPCRLGRFNCFATLLLIGAPLQAAAGKLLDEISHSPVRRQAPLLASASPVTNGAVLRLAGEHPEAVESALKTHLAEVSHLLGEHPWGRRC